MLQKFTYLLSGPVLEKILRVLPYIHLLRFHRSLSALHLRAKRVIPCHLPIYQMPRPNLIERHRIYEPRQLRNESFLPQIRVLAVLVFGTRAGVVDIGDGLSGTEYFRFPLRRDARAAVSAGKELRETPLLELGLRAILFGNLFLHRLEEVLGNQWLVLAGIPVTAPARILEHAAIEGVLEHLVERGKIHALAVAGDEVNVILEPRMHFASAPPLVPDLFEHLLDSGGANGIDDDLTPMVFATVVQVSCRRDTGPESHLHSRLQSSLHVDALVVVLELRLGPEDHEKELLVRVIRESLAVRPNINQMLAIHQIHDASQVSGVTADAIRCPRQYPVEFPAL